MRRNKGWIYITVCVWMGLMSIVSLSYLESARFERKQNKFKQKELDSLDQLVHQLMMMKANQFRENEICFDKRILDKGTHMELTCQVSNKMIKTIWNKKGLQWIAHSWEEY